MRSGIAMPSSAGVGCWRWFTAILVAGACVLGCEKKKGIVLPPPAVEVTAVEKRDVPIYGEWLGTLDGSVNAQVRAQVSGYLISQNYKEGTFVRKDEVLFQIDPRIIQAALEQAKAQQAQAEAQLQRTELDVKRDTPLAKTGAISQQELDNAIQNNLAAKATLEAAKAAVEKAAIDLEFTKITSPIDGIAGLANAQVGDLVGPSTGPLTTVSTVDPIKALFTISELDYLRLGEQLASPEARADFRDKIEFELILPSGKTYRHKGKFFAIQRQVDTRTGTLQIAATFPNPEHLLRPGQFVRLRAQTFHRKDALLIPQRAVNQLQSIYQVAVVGDDNKVQIRTVELAERVGTQWVVSKGLSEGERVVTEGLQKVQDGLKVDIAPTAATQPATQPTTP